MRDLERLSYSVIGTTLRIHSRIGPGCLETVYRHVMSRSLIKQGFAVASEKWISFEFEEERFEERLRADLIVEQALVIEIKSQKALSAIDHQQLLTYLRLLELPMGLLLNFGELHLCDGIKRVLNNYTRSCPSKPSCPS